MKILIAADHGGFQLKEKLKNFLLEENFDVDDLGNSHFESDDNYPEYVLPLAEKVAVSIKRGEEAWGIIIGRSGNGEAIAANKVKGIRAALCMTPEMARKAREHNDANILALGADYIDYLTAKNTIETFLNTEFPGEERHSRRLKLISDYETSKT